LKVYVKLRSNIWVLVSKKIEQTSITGKKKLTRFLLAGESTVGPPSVKGSGFVEIRIPGGIVNRVISRLLDVEGDDVVFVELRDKESYVVKAPKDKRLVIEKIVAELTTKRTSRETS
jgi:hypothetical protein